MMNEKCAVFRDEGGLTRRTRRSTGSRRRPVAAIDDRGTVFNQDVLGALELGYMLDWPSASSSARSSARSRAARSSGSTSPSATTSEWLKHITCR